MNELFKIGGSSVTAELILSICAIFLTVYQAAQTRQHNRLSVRPHLVWDIRKIWGDTCVEVCFSLHNKGVGPAIIKDRYFLLNERRFEGEEPDEVQSLAHSLIGTSFDFHLHHHGLPGIGAALTAGSDFLVAHVVFVGTNRPDEKQLNDIMERAQFKAKYESLYRETFEI